MRNLPKGTYADLRTGRILAVSVRNREMHCVPCRTACQPGTLATKLHNERCARDGERVYPTRRAA